MKIENRQQVLIILTIALLGLLIADNVVFEPLAKWWSVRAEQIADLRQRVSNGKALLARETVIRHRWDSMRARALPASPSLAEQQALKALDNWAHDSGVEITSLMPQWKNVSTNYLTFDCRVETTGSLGALTRLVYQLEKRTLALKLDALDLSLHDNTGQQMTLGLEINGLALLQPQAK